MAAMELALDDIIAQTKKARIGAGRRGGARRGAGGAGGRRGGGGRAPGGGAMFTKSVPAGRWTHDKFNEVYGNGSGRQAQNGGGPRRRSGGSGGGLSARFARSNGGGMRAGGANDIVKLNISNLAETVVTADLEELFEAYKILGVTVHYDEAGRHLGTADVFLTRRTAEEVIKDFTGVAIDGREMKIFVVDENNVGTLPSRVSVSERLARTRSNPIRKRVVGRRSVGGGGGAPRGAGRGRRGGRGSAGGGAGSGPRPKPGTKLSPEDLDKELESYMGSGKHKRISID